MISKSIASLVLGSLISTVSLSQSIPAPLDPPPTDFPDIGEIGPDNPTHGADPIGRDSDVPHDDFPEWGIGNKPSVGWYDDMYKQVDNMRKSADTG